jgi:surface-anchored protein
MSLFLRLPGRRHAGAALLVLLAVLAGAAPAPAATRTVLSVGHVDAVAPQWRDGDLAMQVKDGTASGPAVLRDPQDVLFQVRPEAHMQVPGGLPPSFAFLGAAGDDVWLLPQTQSDNPDVVWAGWSSESVPTGAFAGNRLRWTLRSVDGPGPLQLFENGSFGEPMPIFDSAATLPQTVERPTGTHAHFNWVFHAPGLYRLGFEVAGDRTAGGTASTGPVEYRFFVGATADLPPQRLTIEGDTTTLRQPGDAVAWTAVPSDESRYEDVRWRVRCPADATEREVGRGAAHAFAAAAADDGCAYRAVLLGDAGEELADSPVVVLAVAQPAGDPDPDPIPDPADPAPAGDRPADPAGPTVTTPAAPQPVSPPKAVVRPPALRVAKPAVRGRALALRLRLGVRSEVTLTVRTGGRTVARARSRVVRAGTRTLRVRLDRTLAPGRHTVRVVARASGRTTVKTVVLTVPRRG